MPVSVPIENADIRTGPGKIYFAPLGTALPANTVAASKFTDAWPTGWLPVGPTDSGFETSHAVSTDPVEVEELYTPVRLETTGRTDSVSFTMVADTLQTLMLALNGGNVTTTGSGATTLNKYSPPALGNERRVMIGWEHDSNTIREIFYQCFQTGSVTRQRRKGANKTVYAVEFSLEQPASNVATVTWDHWDTKVGV
jgi:hypothetical protein